jgi:mevalonate kinase
MAPRLAPATASAPGKVILCGEHAVVYGRPALAVPVAALRATATVTPGTGDAFWIDLPDLGRRYRLAEAADDDPIAAAVRGVCARAGLAGPPAGEVRLAATLPIASGLGSGAAATTAVVRALAAGLGLALTAEEVSAVVYASEKLLHGTPSGIDNTVVAFERPVYFVKGQPPRPLVVAQPLRLLIGDTGQPSPTRTTVAAVGAGYAREPERYTRLFDEIGALVERARAVVEGQAAEPLGPLLTTNHALLRELGVSSPELEALVGAACVAGAQGAKLSGGGGGGNMLALVVPATSAAVAAALRRAGAVRVIETLC